MIFLELMLVEYAQTLAREAALWTGVHELLGLDVFTHRLLLHSAWPGANLLLGVILHLLLSLLVHHVVWRVLISFV